MRTEQDDDDDKTSATSATSSSRVSNQSDDLDTVPNQINILESIQNQRKKPAPMPEQNHQAEPKNNPSNKANQRKNSESVPNQGKKSEAVVNQHKKSSRDNKAKSLPKPRFPKKKIIKAKTALPKKKTLKDKSLPNQSNKPESIPKQSDKFEAIPKQNNISEAIPGQSHKPDSSFIQNTVPAIKANPMNAPEPLSLPITPSPVEEPPQLLVPPVRLGDFSSLEGNNRDWNQKLDLCYQWVKSHGKLNPALIRGNNPELADWIALQYGRSSEKSSIFLFEVLLSHCRLLFLLLLRSVCKRLAIDCKGQSVVEGWIQA